MKDFVKLTGRTKTGNKKMECYSFDKGVSLEFDNVELVLNRKDVNKLKNYLEEVLKNRVR